MRRRDVIVALGSIGFGESRHAAAQNRVPRIDYFWLGSAGSDGETLRGFRAGLRDFGYVEGGNITVDRYYADGSETRLDQLAGAAIAAKPDIVVGFGSALLRRIAKLTRTIPIVGMSGDPVVAGLTESLAHPGGNYTGPTIQTGPDIVGKWLELLLEIVPGARRLAMLRNALNPLSATELENLRAYAERLGRGISFQEFALHAPGELGSLLDVIRPGKFDALVVDNDPLLNSKAAEIAAVELPGVGGTSEMAHAGLLLCYGTSILNSARRTGSYIDRILKGAKPGDLPIEQPTKFELVINLKTAKALGLAVPPSLLARADEVIE
ncbi:MAG: ABC transporter substrate-binding protein [Alphaproteobacteria bacterium]|nr:ABC transporter substrate-binding protein [Alphaproteobacteria bacterium]